MKSLRILLLFAVASLAIVCRADEASDALRLSQAIATAEERVNDATGALNAQRDAVASERRPLAKKVDGLEREVAELRREADRLRELRYQDDASREAIDREVAGLQENYDFMLTVLREYRRGFETRLEVAESQRLESRLSAIDDDLDDTKAVTNLLTAMRELFATAEEWNARKLGGISFDGTCLDADGIEQKGRFFVVGPATYFCGEGSGIVVRRVGSSRPAIFPNLDAEHAAPISSACTGAASRLPFDLTSGDALKVAARERSLKDHLVSGGFVMVPLALLGTLAAVLALWKLFILGQVRIPSEDTLNGIAEKLRSGQVEDAQALVSEMAAPFHRVLQAGIDHRELRREHLEEILHERAAATVPSLDRHLGMLAVLGGVAPLLGLLGTVTGMIHTFELVTIFGTGDAKLLSGGISEALVTTETGLIIAVPVLLVHAYLVRRVRNVVSALEASIAAFMNQLQVETTSES